MSTTAETVASIARGELSPVELVETALADLDAAQARTNAVTHVLAEAARARAKALEGKPPQGPLHGVPVAVQEAFDVAGAPTTACCAAFGWRVAKRHAVAVEALVAAGAVIVAKTNQHELTAGSTGAISSFGPVHNPWDPERLAGGSSGGSAAIVAAGAVPLALGSDTGGSIRIPASFCGVTGLKPTHGAISLRGVLPMSPGLDAAGPLAATASDCAVAFRVLRRPERDARLASPTAAPTPEVRSAGLRIGLPGAFFSLVHPKVQTAVEDAARVFEDLGAHIDWVDGPELDEGWEGFKHVWSDVARQYRELWDQEDVHPEVASLIEFGRSLSGLEYAASMARAREIRHSFERALASVDLPLAPATPYPAQPASGTHVEVNGGVLGLHDGSPSRLTVPVNLAGLPALAFPVGFSDGLPLGAQLIGSPLSDEQLLSLGMNYQAATDWHTRLPTGLPPASAPDGSELIQMRPAVDGLETCAPGRPPLVSAPPSPPGSTGRDRRTPWEWTLKAWSDPADLKLSPCGHVG